MVEVRRKIWIIWLSTLILFSTCIPFFNSANAQEGENVSGTGTIRYTFLEGGFYYISSDDGENYDPFNSLPIEFRIDGLRVRFEAITRPGTISYHMFGTIVEIISVEKIQPDGWNESTILREGNNTIRSTSIAVNEPYVHIAWCEDWDIYYMKSEDNGDSWENYRLISDVDTDLPLMRAGYPTIAVDDWHVYIFWFEITDIYYDLYFISSHDNGNTWSDKEVLEEGLSITVQYEGRFGYTGPKATCPGVYVDNGNIFIVWYDRYGGDYDILFKRGYDYGNTWDNKSQIVDYGERYNNSLAPKICVYDDKVFVTWLDDRLFDWSIFYKYSLDGGINWSEDTVLVEDYDGLHPIYDIDVTSIGDYIILVWSDGRNWDPWPGGGAVSNMEIYMKTSPDFGFNWSEDIRFTNASSMSSKPAISSHSNTVTMAWLDYRDDKREVYFSESLDAGQTFNKEKNLTSHSQPNVIYQDVKIANGRFTKHLIWEERTTPGNYTLKYLRKIVTPPLLTGYSPTMSNNDISSEIRMEFSKSMNETSVEQAFSISPAIEIDRITWSNNSSVMLIIPSGNFAQNTTYTVTIGAGAKDILNEASLSTKQWSFHTWIDRDNDGIPNTDDNDDDNDGLPDTWEISNFGNLSQSGTDDFDNDGYNNTAEYESETSPIDPQEMPSGGVPGFELWLIVISTVIVVGFMRLRKSKTL